MANILCMAGLAVVVVGALLTAILSLAGKKTAVPLLLFGLGVAAILGSGLFPQEDIAFNWTGGRINTPQSVNGQIHKDELHGKGKQVIERGSVQISAIEQNTSSVPASVPTPTLQEDQDDSNSQKETGSQTAASAPSEKGESTSSTDSPNSLSTGSGADQQKKQVSWVLNTNTKKIHYPYCRYVSKIAKKNYATSNAEESELLAQGYTKCGHCH